MKSGVKAKCRTIILADVKTYTEEVINRFGKCV
jgi:hypothetical protein